MKFRWGYLRKEVYELLNRRWFKSCFSVDVLNFLAGSIKYKKVSKISVIVYTRDRLDSLKRHTLPSLLSLDFTPGEFEIIIVDNSESAEVFEYLKSIKNNLVRVARETERGIGRTLSRGIGLSSGDVVTFLEDDMEVDPKWLARIRDFHNSGKYLMGQGLIYDEVYRRIINKVGHPQPEKNFADGNWSFRRQVFDFVSFNKSIVYGAEGHDLMSQVMTYWPEFNHYLDEVPIKHFREPSEYRNKTESFLNSSGIRMEKKMYGLWYVNQHILRRNLNIDRGVFVLRFWLKEALFLVPEMLFVYGDLLILVKTKAKLYRQLHKLRTSYLKWSPSAPSA